MTIKDIAINWRRVKETLMQKERISPASAEAIRSAADYSIKKASKLVSPKALFLKKKVSALKADHIELDGDIKLSGKSLSRYIAGAECVYLFLVTIGPAIETEASGLMNSSDGLTGYILDRVGSIAVEALAGEIEDSIRREHEAKNKSVSMRFSPGYCDWPVVEQLELDKILSFSKIGVKLTDGLMMIPRKSISGMVAIGPKGLFSKAKSQCGICKVKECSYRRA